MLTLNAVQKALDDAVALKGEDYVYEKAGGDCAYSTNPANGDPTPSCIVGYVLNALDPEAFQEVAQKEWYKYNAEGRDKFEDSDEDDTGYYLDSTTVDGIGTRWGVTVFDDAEEGVSTLLYYAQQYQDSGSQWGRAVEKARQEAAHFVADSEA